MFGLPRGEVLFIKKDNSLKSVMFSDITSYEMFIHEINYLFNKCGYNKNDFLGAKYVYNEKIIFEIKF